MSGTKVDGETVLRAACTGDAQALYDVTAQSVQGLAITHYKPEQLEGGWENVLPNITRMSSLRAPRS